MLEFSEDVWIVDDLKNATFPSPVETTLRDMQELEYLPYLDVSIDWGGINLEFWPEKFLYDYDVVFIDSKTI